jgi:hypothetical protein
LDYGNISLPGEEPMAAKQAQGLIFGTVMTPPILRKALIDSGFGFLYSSFVRSNKEAKSP